MCAGGLDGCCGAGGVAPISRDPTPVIGTAAGTQAKTLTMMMSHSLTSQWGHTTMTPRPELLSSKAHRGMLGMARKVASQLSHAPDYLTATLVRPASAASDWSTFGPPVAGASPPLIVVFTPCAYKAGPPVRPVDDVQPDHPAWAGSTGATAPHGIGFRSPNPRVCTSPSTLGGDGSVLHPGTTVLLEGAR